MARGNQRDKAREKNQKEMAGKLSGTEFAKEKENVASIMRAKQAAGNVTSQSRLYTIVTFLSGSQEGGGRRCEEVMSMGSKLLDRMSRDRRPFTRIALESEKQTG
ncbi:hypothetical protein LTR60_001635 [Cryomyces antarcticus]|nr:hypothetical protein LTR60_001635 [Cryomyces antarcticus]